MLRTLCEHQMTGKRCSRKPVDKKNPGQHIAIATTVRQRTQALKPVAGDNFCHASIDDANREVMGRKRTLPGASGAQPEIFRSVLL